MTSDPIPMIEVRGSHRDVGRQIGEHIRPALQQHIDFLRGNLPQGVTWEQMLDRGRQCLGHSRAVYPQYIDELEGTAEAAGVPFEELFLGVCEELWEPAAWGLQRATQDRGCTDMAARGRATADGSTLVAHTNDLSPRAEEALLIVKVRAGDEPEFLGITPGGLAYSAGFNAAGVSLTGNEVACNDIRPGVPRLLMVRAILAARRLEEAMWACLVPQRASNYNNLLADANGEIYCMEGSATDCEPIYAEGDILAHANHYVSPPMRRFEADRNAVANSVVRYNRAWRLLRENYGRLTPQLFMALLADHANYPASICKHGLESVTVFSLILRLQERRAWIGRGRPCQTTYHEYALQPWQPPGDWPRG